jgi:thioredoxin reductase (NADPH)
LRRHGPHSLRAQQQSRLGLAGIEILDGPCFGFELKSKLIEIRLQGQRRSFASVYPALGSDVRSELALDVGAHVSEEAA